MAYVWIIASAVWLLLNMFATVAVIHDENLLRNQKGAQLGLVWLLPIAGALVVLWFHWRNADDSLKGRNACSPSDETSTCFDVD